jgi:hypothetical protein
VKGLIIMDDYLDELLEIQQQELDEDELDDQALDL